VTEIKPAKTIEELRAMVDIIDARILDLLKQRVQFAKDMGAIKKKTGRTLRDAARENEILRRIALENSRSEPILLERDLNVLYSQVMHICLKAQEQEQK
jgi:chorismate mutase